MSSNLPPGVSASSIPGERAEDAALESAEERLLDYLSRRGVRPEEYELVAHVGYEAVVQARELVRIAREDEREAVRMEERPQKS